MDTVTVSHPHRMVHPLDLIYRQPARICLHRHPDHTVLHRSVVAVVVSHPVGTAASHQVSLWAVVMAVDSLQAAVSVVDTEDTLQEAVMVVVFHLVVDMEASRWAVVADTMQSAAAIKPPKVNTLTPNFCTRSSRSS